MDRAPSYFVDDQPPLSALLGAHRARAAAWFATLPAGLAEALVLGGGYGRGEGGARAGTAGPALFNDLDYFLFASAPADPALRAAKEAFERAETAALGIDVEVTALSPAQAARTGDTMMLRDLRAGHVPVAGPPDYVLRLVPERPWDTLPLVEGTRLLWNRGSGLYFAGCALADGRAGAAEFAHRNHQKARLALGDAELVRRRRYRPTVRERLAQAESCLAGDALADYRAAAEFKFRPPGETPPAAALAAAQAELTARWLAAFLAFEGDRLGRPFADAAAYAAHSGRLYPAERSARNLLLALRDRLRRGGCLRPALDYPRGALQRALVLLLAGAAAGVSRFLPAAAVPAPERGRAAAWEAPFRRWWAAYS